MKVVFSNAVNLSGLYSSEPLQLKWSENLKSWWGDSGNYVAKELGYVEEGGRIQFTAYDRLEVERWTLGVKSAMLLLNRWSGT